MSEKEPPQTYRGMMVKQEGDSRSRLGDPLIEVNPKHLDARTRLPSIMAMATLATLSKYASKDDFYSHPSGAKFHIRTLSGLMDCWEFQYEAKAPSLDGKSRDEYVKVASFIAVGQGDESGILTSSLLNEGSKNLGGKSSKTQK